MTAFGVVYITRNHETQSPEINLLLLVSEGLRFTGPVHLCSRCADAISLTHM